MAGLATPPGGNPTGASGPHATAACPPIGDTGRLTRTTTDSHREARPARLTSGASTPHQPLRPLRAGLPLGPSPHDAAPTPSLSQWRSELSRPIAEERGWLPSLGQQASGTRAISGSRPYANHTDRFYCESAALRCSAFPAVGIARAQRFWDEPHALSFRAISRPAHAQPTTSDPTSTTGMRTADRRPSRRSRSSSAIPSIAPPHGPTSTAQATPVIANSATAAGAERRIASPMRSRQ